MRASSSHPYSTKEGVITSMPSGRRRPGSLRGTLRIHSNAGGLNTLGTEGGGNGGDQERAEE